MKKKETLFFAYRNVEDYEDAKKAARTLFNGADLILLGDGPRAKKCKVVGIDTVDILKNLKVHLEIAPPKEEPSGIKHHKPDKPSDMRVRFTPQYYEDIGKKNGMKVRDLIDRKEKR